MSITAKVTGRTAPLEVVDYAVTEDATPLAPGDSSGGVGSIDITAAAVKDGAIVDRTAIILDKDVMLSDVESIEDSPFKGRGTIFGHIIKNSEPGGKVSFTADTILSRLNTDRVAEAFYGVRRTDDLITYETNMCANPSLETVTTGYTAVPGTTGVATVSRSNATIAAYAGSYHGRVTWTTAATAPGGVTFGNIDVTPGDVLSAAVRAQTSIAAGQIVRMSVDWKTSGGAAISTTVGEAVPITSVGWTDVSIAGVIAPATAARAVITLYNYNNGGAQFVNWPISSILYFDALMVNTGTSPLPYFDGSSTDASWIGVPNASASRLTIRTPQDVGYDATLANAFRYYCGLVGIPDTALRMDTALETISVAYPRWEGNVWDYLKQLCTATGLEMVLSGETIVIRAPRSRELSFENKDSIVRTVDSQATALNVDIYNYNSRWLSDAVAFSATSAYTLSPNEVQEFYVTTTASLGSVNDPVVVAAMGADYSTGTGQYVVMDSNNAVVDPATWKARGGRVSAELDPARPGEIKVVIAAPLLPAVYKAPYRLVQGVEGDRPALAITGTGVFINKELLRIPTGATVTQTSNEVAPTVDNIFISTATQAADRGILAAIRAGGPSITITGSMAYDPTANGQEFGAVVGSRIEFEFGMYRITNVTYTSSQINFTAESDTIFGDVTAAYSETFAEFNETYDGFTFTTWNALWPALMTFAEYQATTGSADSFDALNAIYANLTFNDHAIYPLMTELVTTNAEARR